MLKSIRKAKYPASKCPKLKKSIAAIDISSLFLAIKVILNHQLISNIFQIIKINFIL